MAIERERKFLVKITPENLASFRSFEIEQGYLSTSPTLRIRKKGDAYILTVKENLVDSSGDVVNREEEFSLSKDAYLHLREKCDGGFVCKTRYVIPIENTGLYAELDVFHQLNDLQVVEVEFPDESASKSFVIPEWFGAEVTDNADYRNVNIAKRIAGMTVDK